MLLTGHAARLLFFWPMSFVFKGAHFRADVGIPCCCPQGEVLTMKFNPEGTVVASGSHDRHIFLWNVHGDCKNFMLLKVRPSKRCS